MEVLDFVDFLQRKLEEKEKRKWNEFSFESAMRGIEDEKALYSLKDLKETFS